MQAAIGQTHAITVELAKRQVKRNFVASRPAYGAHFCVLQGILQNHLIDSGFQAAGRWRGMVQIHDGADGQASSNTGLVGALPPQGQQAGQMATS